MDGLKIYKSKEHDMCTKFLNDEARISAPQSTINMTFQTLMPGLALCFPSERNKQHQAVWIRVETDETKEYLNFPKGS